MEGTVEFKAYAVSTAGTPVELDSTTRAHLVRMLQGATRLKDPSEVRARSDLAEIESQLFMGLRLPSDQEISDGVRYSIWPIAAVTIVP